MIDGIASEIDQSQNPGRGEGMFMTILVKIGLH
jgi:hypothetical protein